MRSRCCLPVATADWSTTSWVLSPKTPCLNVVLNDPEYFSVTGSWLRKTTTTMKRRNVTATLEGGKPRRAIKRSNKISENIYGSTLVYVKLMLLWALVLLADHFLEFRFEYLWPFWLFLRSVYDSFKYQGLAFSVFFIAIAVTSDMICFLFVPVHWLFFAASTYVWVQYVWHTEKGICVPTVFLWLIFVYIEASIRLKELRASIELKQLPFHLDLCRPFAAHCIGYPVVTLGFGFKTYVGFRMRQRRQKEVQKVNEYYYEFLREALPPGPLREEAFNPHPSPNPCSEDRISDGSVVITPSSSVTTSSSPLPSAAASNGGSLVPSSSSGCMGSLSWNGTTHHNTSNIEAKQHQHLSLLPSSKSNCSPDKLQQLQTEDSSPSSSNVSFSAAKSPFSRLLGTTGTASNGAIVVSNGSGSTNHHSSSHGSGGGELACVDKIEEKSSDISVSDGYKPNLTTSSGSCSTKSAKSGSGGGTSASAHSSRDACRKTRGGQGDGTAKVMTRDDQIAKLEADYKKLKNDLQVSRNKENDLRDQIVSYMSKERTLKSEISNLQVEKSVLETRVSSLVSVRAGEKAALSGLEKKLGEERKQKLEFQTKLEQERKSKKEAAHAERSAYQTQARHEVARLEADIKSLRSELQLSRERCQQAENEAYSLRKAAEQHGDPKILANTLDQMREKNGQIEKSLSSETKLKMDLFSALGEAKRELGIRGLEVQKKDAEIAELRKRIAEVLAVMPSAGGAGSLGCSNGASIGAHHHHLASAAPPPLYPPSTFSLDLPQATELSSFNAATASTASAVVNNNKLSSLGLSNLEDKLVAAGETSASRLAVSSFGSAFSRSNGNNVD